MMKVIRRSRYISWNSFDRTPKGFTTVDFSWTDADGRLHQIHRRRPVSSYIELDRFPFDFDDFDRDRWLSDGLFDRPLFALDGVEFPRVRSLIDDGAFEVANPLMDVDFEAMDSDAIDVEVVAKRPTWKASLENAVSNVSHRLRQWGKRLRGWLNG
ncbi:hypothetical protein [Baaleninema sp.]|uniref:hypothetical protein n=1 Tax=Baaleninema sp. TaxID=3101197 RepID=UPI003D027F47